MNNFRKQAQAILGFVFALIAILVLTLGVARIWTWFNANYAHHAVSYQTSRLLAAKPGTYQYYDNIPADQESYIDISKGISLPEDWVLKGDTSKFKEKDKVGSFEAIPLAFDSSGLQCVNECLKEPDCGDSVADFNNDCPCHLQCDCKAQVKDLKEAWNGQKEALRKQKYILWGYRSFVEGQIFFCPMVNIPAPCAQTDRLDKLWRVCDAEPPAQTIPHKFKDLIPDITTLSKLQLLETARRLRKDEQDTQDQIYQLRDNIRDIPSCCNIKIDPSDPNAPKTPAEQRRMQRECMSDIASRPIPSLVAQREIGHWNGWIDELTRERGQLQDAAEEIGDVKDFCGMLPDLPDILKYLPNPCSACIPTGGICYKSIEVPKACCTKILGVKVCVPPPWPGACGWDHIKVPYPCCKYGWEYIHEIFSFIDSEESCIMAMGGGDLRDACCRMLFSGIVYNTGIQNAPCPEMRGCGNYGSYSELGRNTCGLETLRNQINNNLVPTLTNQIDCFTNAISQAEACISDPENNITDETRTAYEKQADCLDTVYNNNPCTQSSPITEQITEKGKFSRF